MRTNFGKILWGLIIERDINQEKLAKELGVSSSTLSNYMTGKNIPEMGLIDTCIRRFALKGKMIKDIFSKAFSSMAAANHKIVLDTRFFKPERIETLAQIITVLLLYPDSPNMDPTYKHNLIEGIKSNIQLHFSYLDLEVNYNPPSADEISLSVSKQVSAKSEKSEAIR
jgi:transcriptional regulator with XRE-family HTH domain